MAAVRSRIIAPSAGFHPEGVVSFKELLEQWQQTGRPPLTAAEYAVRLPIDDAARLQALADMYPGTSREQIITDLLGAALKELAAALPYVKGSKVISTDEHGDPVYEDAGPTAKFVELTRKHRKKLSLPGKA
jgi:hypothetical protein